MNCKSPLSESAAEQGRQMCAVVRILPRGFLLEFLEIGLRQKTRGLGGSLEILINSVRESGRAP